MHCAPQFEFRFDSFVVAILNRRLSGRSNLINLQTATILHRQF